MHFQCQVKHENGLINRFAMLDQTKTWTFVEILLKFKETGNFYNDVSRLHTRTQRLLFFLFPPIWISFPLETSNFAKFSLANIIIINFCKSNCYFENITFASLKTQAYHPLFVWWAVHL